MIFIIIIIIIEMLHYMSGLAGTFQKESETTIVKKDAGAKTTGLDTIIR